MKNHLNISHILICLAFQGIGCALTKNTFIGAIAGIFFFTGGEIAQAEYKNIEASESNLIEMVVRWNGNTEIWPLPEGTYAVKRSEVDFSKIQYKPQDDGR